MKPLTLKPTLKVVDLFAGAGGATCGVMQAAREMGFDVDLVAVNHWKAAVETHEKNFPGHVHYCQRVGPDNKTLDWNGGPDEQGKVRPREAVPGGYVDILVAGPECTHFTKASGKKAKNRQSRTNAFDIIWWLEELDVRNVLIENVEEFLTWGPLDENDEPIPALKGYFFRLFVETLEELGYAVEWRILCAADYGDPTTRKRFFLMATKGGSPRWPVPTHRPPAQLAHFPKARPWRTAREIIDWSLKGESIYTRKKPPCENTRKRILTGFRKFAGLPFVVQMAHSTEGDARRCYTLDAPLPTVTTKNSQCLALPYLVPNEGIYRGNAPRGVSDPVPTITQRGAGGLAEPYLVVLRNNCDAADLSSPVQTLCGGNHVYLAEPWLYYGYGGRVGTTPNKPLPTVAASWEHLGIVEPFLLRYNGGKGGENRTQPLSAPITTLDTSNRFALCEFVVKYNGTGDGAVSLADPLDTVTTHDRFALVELVFVREERAGAFYEARIVGWIDILFRMLTPRELAAAHSFPANYWFPLVQRGPYKGQINKSAAVKMIGNSWPVQMGAALVKTMLSRPVHACVNANAVRSSTPWRPSDRAHNLIRTNHAKIHDLESLAAPASDLYAGNGRPA